jgi:hypothetical protein
MKYTDVKKKSKKRFELSDEIRSMLTGLLNEVHGSSYSHRFWGIVLEPHIRACIRQKKILEKETLRTKPEQFPAGGTIVDSYQARFKNRIKLIIKHFRSRKSRRRAGMLLAATHEIRIGFPESPEMQDILPGKRIGSWQPYFFGSGDKIARKKCDSHAIKIEDPFRSNIVKTLPTIYLEHFREMLETVALNRAEIKTIHIHNLNDIYSHFLAAWYAEQGACVCWYQHGSHYGEYEWDYFHYFEHEHADEFRTWGWKMREKDTPWGGYRLEKFRIGYLKFQNNSPAYDLLLCYPSMSSEYREHNVKSTGELLGKLSTNQYRNILARPRPVHKKSSQAGQLSFLKNNRVVISDGLAPIEREVANSRLVIQLNVPGTNFLECIFVNHPTVGLLRNDEPAGIVKPFYDFLLDKKVLHFDTDSMIAHLNEMDLNSWWADVIAEPMYNTFKHTYTREIGAVGDI